ncbi:MAG: ABC transporter permease [Deltaproteobacteria bacterium]|nr:ABC transporter permease [Deltaproteobacteria bacterium]
MILEGISEGLNLLFCGDAEVWSIVSVSVRVSACSTAIAAALALPVGLLVGQGRFRGRRIVLTVLNTLMALPTVLVGLLVYAFISRSGPLGGWELLYTPAAMIVGQVVLAFPIIAGFTAAGMEKADPRILLTVRALGAGRLRSLLTAAAEGRAALAGAVAAGFGRVFAEVGVSMMLGGNIRGSTRNITTGIAFETGKGEFALGVALGVVLLGVALGVNLLVSALGFRSGRRA